MSVRAELPGYTPTTKTSASRTIAKVFTTAPVPTIGGDAAIGATLTATRGTWSPSTDVTYTYRWLRDGVAISGATGLTYKVVDADADTFLTFAVTAKKSGYTTTTVVSEPISLHLP